MLPTQVGLEQICLSVEQTSGERGLRVLLFIAGGVPRQCSLSHAKYSRAGDPQTQTNPSKNCSFSVRGRTEACHRLLGYACGLCSTIWRATLAEALSPSAVSRGRSHLDLGVVSGRCPQARIGRAPGDGIAPWSMCVQLLHEMPTGQVPDPHAPVFHIGQPKSSPTHKCLTDLRTR